MAQRGEKPFLRPLVVEPLQGVAEARLRDAHADLARGDRLQRVRLVEDHEIVGKDVPRARVIVGRRRPGVQEEERMVGHHHICGKKPLARRLVEAAPLPAAALHRAEVLLAAHLRPDGRVRLHIEVRQRAVFRGLRPFPDAPEFLLLGRSKEVARVVHRPLQPPPAEVVLPPLPEHRLELHGEQLAEDRDVLVDELLLEIDRVGGEHRLFPLLLSEKDRRDEVGERFADARSRLHDEVPLLRQRARHRHRHLLLLAAVFEIARLREQPVRRENLPDPLDELIVDALAQGNHRKTASLPPERGGFNLNPQISGCTGRKYAASGLPPAKAVVSRRRRASSARREKECLICR